MTIEYPTAYDTRPSHVRADWTLDTPSGPIPLSGGNITIDRTWTPTLTGTLEASSSHPLLDEVHPLTTEPLYLRLRTQYAYGEQLDDEIVNIATNASFEAGTSPWSAAGSSTTIAASSGWAASGTQSLRVIANTGSTTSGDARHGSPVVRAFGMEPGKRYRIEATMFIPAAHQLDNAAATSRQRRIMAVVYDYSGSSNDLYIEYGEQAPNEAGSHRLSLEFDIPAGTTGVAILLGSAPSSQDASFVTYWDDLLIHEADTGTLGEYEWPEWDGRQKIDHAAWQVYPRSKRTDRVNGLTSIEVASGEIALYEQRNATGAIWRPRPDSFIESPRLQVFRLERVINQAALFAGVPVTVNEQAALTFSVENTPEWAPGETLWAFVTSLLRSTWGLTFNPVVNALQAWSSIGGVPADDPVNDSTLISSTLTEGDSTELGVLDFYDGLLINWTWTSSHDGGGTHRRQTVHIAPHLESWRDVTKWRVLDIASSPQPARGDHMVQGVAARVTQGTHTLAIEPWTIADFGLKWDYPITREAMAFSIAGSTITYTRPLPD